MSLVKCVYKDMCRFVTDPEPIGILSIKSMKFLGYIGCRVDGQSYLATALRPCGSREVNNDSDKVLDNTQG